MSVKCGHPELQCVNTEGSASDRSGFTSQITIKSIRNKTQTVGGRGRPVVPAQYFKSCLNILNTARIWIDVKINSRAGQVFMSTLNYKKYEKKSN